MKKTLILLWVSLISLINHSYAQDAQKTLWWNPESNLWDVTLRFCNDKTIEWWTKTLELSTKPWEITDICVLLNNTWPTPVRLWLNFVDGSTTADKDAKKACQPEDTKTYFWQYVTYDSTWFYLEPWKTLQTIAKVQFSSGYAWMAYGCATFQILDSQPENSWMFKVISRRANFIDIYVDGTLNVWLWFTWDNNPSIKNISDDQNIVIYNNLPRKTISTKVIAQNTGNVWLSGSIQASYAYLRFLKWSLWSGTFKILPNLSMPYEFDLPRYVQYIGWPISVQYDLDYIPEIIWTDSQNIVKEYNASISANTFLIPWLLIAIIVLIIIYIIYHKHKKSKKSSNTHKNHKNKNTEIIEA